MATTNPITVRRDVRQLRRPSNSFYITAAPILGMQSFGVDLCIPPTPRLAHGCTVSISRGSPPPEKGKH